MFDKKGGLTEEESALLDSVLTPSPATTPSATSPSSGLDLDTLLDAFSSQESGGNYGIRNSATATGKYQVIDKNIRAWSKRWWGKELTPQEFANNPTAQEYIVRKQMGEYLANRGGNIREIAKDWYGRGQAPAGHPTPDQYAAQLEKRYRELSKGKGASTGEKDVSSVFDEYLSSVEGAPSEASDETPETALTSPVTQPTSAPAATAPLTPAEQFLATARGAEPRVSGTAAFQQSGFEAKKGVSSTGEVKEVGGEASDRFFIELGIDPERGRKGQFTPQEITRIQRAYTDRDARLDTAVHEAMAGTEIDAQSAQAAEDWRRAHAAGVGIPEEVVAQGLDAVNEYFAGQVLPGGRVSREMYQRQHGKLPSILEKPGGERITAAEFEAIKADPNNWYDNGQGSRALKVRTDPAERERLAAWSQEYLANKDIRDSYGWTPEGEDMIRRRAGEKRYDTALRRIAEAEWQQGNHGLGLDEDKETYIKNRVSTLRGHVDAVGSWQSKLLNALDPRTGQSTIGKLLEANAALYGVDNGMMAELNLQDGNTSWMDWARGAQASANRNAGNFLSGLTGGVLGGYNAYYDPEFWKLPESKRREFLNMQRGQYRGIEEYGDIGRIAGAITAATPGAAGATLGLLGGAKAVTPAVGRIAARAGLAADGYAASLATGAVIGAGTGAASFGQAPSDPKDVGNRFNPAASFMQNIGALGSRTAQSAADMAAQFGTGKLGDELGTAVGALGSKALPTTGRMAQAGQAAQAGIRQASGRIGEGVGEVLGQAGSDALQGKISKTEDYLSAFLLGAALGGPSGGKVVGFSDGRFASVDTDTGVIVPLASPSAAELAGAVPVDQVLGRSVAYSDVIGKNANRDTREELAGRLGEFAPTTEVGESVFRGTEEARRAGEIASTKRKVMLSDPIKFEQQAVADAAALEELRVIIASEGGTIQAVGEETAPVRAMRIVKELAAKHGEDTLGPLLVALKQGIATGDMALGVKQVADMANADIAEVRRALQDPQVAAEAEEISAVNNVKRAEQAVVKAQGRVDAAINAQFIETEERNDYMRRRAAAESELDTAMRAASEARAAGSALMGIRQSGGRVDPADLRAALGRVTEADAQVRASQAVLQELDLEGQSRVDRIRQEQTEAQQSLEAANKGLLEAKAARSAAAVKVSQAREARSRSLAERDAVAEPVFVKRGKLEPEALASRAIEVLTRNMEAGAGASGTVAADGSVPTKGYMVAVPGAEEARAVTPGSPEAVAFIKEFTAKPEVQNLLANDPNAHLGMWFSEETGELFLDVSRRYDSGAEARQKGAQEYQYSIFDLSRQEGDGGFIDTGDRRRELEEVKAQYEELRKESGAEKLTSDRLDAFAHIAHAALEKAAQDNGITFKEMLGRVVEGSRLARGENRVVRVDAEGNEIPSDDDGKTGEGMEDDAITRLHQNVTDEALFFGDQITYDENARAREVLIAVATGLEASARRKRLEGGGGGDGAIRLPGRDVDYAEYVRRAVKDFADTTMAELETFVLGDWQMAPWSVRWGKSRQEMTRDSFQWYTVSVKDMLRTISGEGTAENPTVVDADGKPLFPELHPDTDRLQGATAKGKELAAKEQALFKVLTAVFSPGADPDSNFIGTFALAVDYKRLRKKSFQEMSPEQQASLREEYGEWLDFDPSTPQLPLVNDSNVAKLQGVGEGRLQDAITPRGELTQFNPSMIRATLQRGGLVTARAEFDEAGKPVSRTTVYTGTGYSRVGHNNILKLNRLAAELTHGKAGVDARGNVLKPGDLHAAVEWMATPHPLAEVLEAYNFMAETEPNFFGWSGNPSSIVVDGQTYGAYAFGPKIGAFAGNLLGIGELLTPDLWATRTWNRVQGTLLDPEHGVAGEPRNEKEREAMREGFREVARRLTALSKSNKKFAKAIGVDPKRGHEFSVMEAQSMLWYLEQQVWARAGHSLAISRGYNDAATRQVKEFYEKDASRRAMQAAIHSYWAASDPEEVAAEILSIKNKKVTPVGLQSGTDERGRRTWTVMVNGEPALREEDGTPYVYTNERWAKLRRGELDRLYNPWLRGVVRIASLQAMYALAAESKGLTPDPELTKLFQAADATEGGKKGKGKGKGGASSSVAAMDARNRVVQAVNGTVVNVTVNNAREAAMALALGGGVVTDDLVATMLAERPQYLSDVGRYLIDQRRKLVAGEMTTRDVAKAYLLTLSSIKAMENLPGTVDAKIRGEAPIVKADPDKGVEEVKRPLNPELLLDRDMVAPNGTVIPYSDFLSQKGGKDYIRPEDFFAKVLLSPDGQVALDEIEAAVKEGRPLDMTLLEPLRLGRQIFGSDTLANAFLEPKKGEFSLHNIGDMVKAVNEAGGDLEALGVVVKRARGIGDGKQGFIKQLLGLGGTPTVDAVEINYWLTGEGNPRAENLGEARSKMVEAAKGATGPLSKELARLVSTRLAGVANHPKIADQLTELDLDPNVFQTVMHHWLWDRAKGTETSHRGFYKAMRLAQAQQTRGTIVNGETRFIGDLPALISLFSTADISTLAHETAHGLRRFLAPEDMAIAEEWVQKVTRIPIRGGKWQVPHEEAFARGFEQYLLEGTIPAGASETMKGVFEKMKGYLAEIYKGLLQVPSLAGQLDDRIRGVYDRMLGIDSERGLSGPEEKADRRQRRLERDIASAKTDGRWKRNRPQEKDINWALAPGVPKLMRRTLAPFVADVIADISIGLDPSAQRVIDAYSQGQAPGKASNLSPVAMEAMRRYMETQIGKGAAAAQGLLEAEPHRRMAQAAEVAGAYAAAVDAYGRMFPGKTGEAKARFDRLAATRFPGLFAGNFIATAHITGTDTQSEAFRAKLAKLEAALGQSRAAAAKAVQQRATQLYQDSREAPEGEGFQKWFAGSVATDGEGNPLVLYHGTTHDFEAFDVDRSSSMSFMGAGVYLTTLPEDASNNYAKIGPDLNFRIQQRTEELWEEFGDADDPVDLAERYIESSGLEGQAADSLMAAAEEAADGEYVSWEDVDAIGAIATKELYGGTENVMPLFLSMKNPVYIDAFNGKGNEPEFFGAQYNEEEDEFEEHPSLDRLKEAFDAASEDVELDDWTTTDTWASLREFVGMAYEGVSIAEIVAALRKDEALANARDPYTGEDLVMKFITHMVTGLGYDGFVMDADRHFRMGSLTSEETGESAFHFIALKPTQVKSVHNSGAFSAQDASVLRQGATQFFDLQGVHADEGLADALERIRNEGSGHGAEAWPQDVHDLIAAATAQLERGGGTYVDSAVQALMASPEVKQALLDAGYTRFAYKGVTRWTETGERADPIPQAASQGDPLTHFGHKTPRVADHSNTPEFKAWFGGSKVTNSDGTPRVVFHGSLATFDRFDPGWSSYAGLFFASHRKAAESYAQQSSDVSAGGDSTPSRGGVYSVYLKIENPLVVDGTGKKFPEPLTATLDGKTVKTDSDELIELAKKAGHDGVIIKGYRDGGGVVGDIYVVYSGSQVKEVRNSGAFNPADLSIFHQSAGQADIDAALALSDEITQATWGEILGAIRKAAMLSSPKTHLRNVISNTAFQLMEESTTFPAAIVDSLAALRYGERTISYNILDAMKASKFAFSVQDGAAVWEKGGVRRFLDELYGLPSTTGTEAPALAWNKKGLGWLEKTTNAAFSALKAEDAFFNAFAIRRSLINQGRLAVGRGEFADINEYLANPPEADIDLAAADALIATFNNGNVTSDALRELKASLRLGGGFGKTLLLAFDTLVPFERTPTNIFYRLIDYTPVLGLLGTGRRGLPGDSTEREIPSNLFSKLVALERGRKAEKAAPASPIDAHFDRRTQNLLQREMAKQVGRQMIGTLVMVGAALGAAGGFINGDDDDELRRLNEETGRSEKALKVGGRWYRLDSLSPVGALVNLGATWGEARAKGLDNSEIFTREMEAAVQIALDLPLVRGFSTGVDVVDVKEKGWGTGANRFIGSVIASFIPSVMADIAEFSDETKRRDPRPEGLLDFDAMLNQAKGKIPGLRQTLPEKRSLSGQPVDRSPSIGGRLRRSLDPFNSTEDRADKRPVLAELDRLGVSFPKVQRNTGETIADWEAREAARVTKAEAFLDRLIASTDYANLKGRKDSEGKDMQAEYLKRAMKAVYGASLTSEKKAKEKLHGKPPKKAEEYPKLPPLSKGS